MDKSVRKSRKLKVEILDFCFLVSAFAFGQTHTMPASNVVPSGANLTIQWRGNDYRGCRVYRHGICWRWECEQFGHADCRTKSDLG